MPSDTRTSAEIERDIEQERAGLTDTLEDLQDKFSSERIIREISNQFRDHGGDIGRSVSNAVKENPLALTLTGVGLAWLMFGHGPRADTISRKMPRRGADFSGDYGDYATRDRYATDDGMGGDVYGAPYGTPGDNSRSMGDHMSSAGQSLRSGASSVGRSAMPDIPRHRACRARAIR